MTKHEIDRITPTLRPTGDRRGYQRWRRLLFAHYPVPAAELARLLPRGITLDTFDGQAFVGIVPFWMEGVRPRWAPEALAFEFLETNVRTYVHVDGQDPGVYFLSLDAASRIAVLVARAGWGLPYFVSRMSESRAAKAIQYQLAREDDPTTVLHTAYVPGPELGPSKPGSFQHFLVERYWLHLEKGGEIWSGQVHHPAYPVHSAEIVEWEQTLTFAGGVVVPLEKPPIVHYSPGVDVDIYDLAPRPHVATRT